jgi:hypothetical protein
MTKRVGIEPIDDLASQVGENVFPVIRASDVMVAR